MKLASPVFCMMLLSALVFSGQPAWSQETTQDATQMETQPAVADETQPAAADETQPAAADETQPAAADETQPAAADETQPAAADETQPAAADETQAVVPDESQTTSSGDSQATASGESQPAVQIPEAVVCQEVVDRAPVGAADVFAKEVPRVYCFTRVVGADPGTQLVHNWYYQGNLKASVTLNVGSSDYRTWSYKTMMPQWTGEWMVEILSANGTPLENIIFVLK